MKVFFTGHPGYVDPHLVEVLKSGGHQVTSGDLGLCGGAENAVRLNHELFTRELIAQEAGHNVLFHETSLPGAYVVELEKRADDRGFFARVFCRNEFRQAGLVGEFIQVNNSLSKEQGTLRGMHYQLSPRSETKIVRCIRGALWDCIVDLRQGSPTFGKWFGETLSAENRKMMYVPKGFAHGLITLEPDTEAFYLADEFYSPEHERGLRWNDATFGIRWPAQPRIVSEKDAGARDFDPNWHLTLTPGETAS